MRPFSNIINISLLIITIALLTYYLVALITILSGKAILVGPIYPLYISIGVNVFLIMVFLESIMARNRWERDHKGIKRN